jgi:hypothetical protein
MIIFLLLPMNVCGTLTGESQLTLIWAKQELRRNSVALLHMRRRDHRG